MTIFIHFVYVDLNWPDFKITGQSQTVHVPNCPNTEFFLTFPKPIWVICLKAVSLASFNSHIFIVSPSLKCSFRGSLGFII